MAGPVDSEIEELTLPGLPEPPAGEGGGARKAARERGVARSGPAKADRHAAKAERQAAMVAPVARVAVDVSLAHLDRPFDYLVPAEADGSVRPGVRVKVRFAGQLLDGIVLERLDASEHDGKLAFLEKVVSPERVLTEEVAGLARAVADRYAGTLADVLRLAVPPRHARAERVTGARVDDDRAEAVAARTAGPGRTALALGITCDRPEPAPGDPASPVRPDGVDHQAAKRPGSASGAAGPVSGGRAVQPGGWAAYPAGEAFLAALAEGRPARAVWTAVPGEDWPARVAEAVAATRAAGRGALVVVADARDLDRVDAALTAAGDAHVALSAALGPEQRYVRFLRAARGDVAVVAGTRAAAFAPVADLGLVVIWDDGDDLHAEPRAPYPHVREVLLTRAQLAGTAALVGAYGRTAEAQQLVETGWAKEIVADRDTLRARAPLVTPVTEDERDPGRLPSIAWRAARDAIAADAPVLVQVPRRGYIPSVACQECRTPARCPHCHGPLSLSTAAGPAVCRWCARIAAGYACPKCGGRQLRASVVGARRTAEELGRAFTDVPVLTSGRDGVLATVPDRAALVVATPGAEPVVTGAGYGAVLLLDTWALLTRADLRAGEEALRRWLSAAALARPADRGGQVVVIADGALAPVQALLRFDPGWLAARDLAERRDLGFPPAARMASLAGPAEAVADLLSVARLPAGAEVLGPVAATDGQERYLVRVPRAAARRLADELRAAAGVRSARKAADTVRIQVDPLELW